MIPTDGPALMTWLTEAEMVAFLALDVPMQRTLVTAAKECSTSPEGKRAPGYRSICNAYDIRQYRKLLEAMAGPVRKRQEKIDWDAVLVGIVEGRARRGAGARARAREHLRLVQGEDATPTDDETVPPLIWPRDWSAQRCRAADYFVAGATPTEVAESVGIALSTASRWWNHDQEFRACIANQRRALNEHRLGRLQRLGDVVLDKLLVAVQSDDITVAELIKLAPHIFDRIGLVKTERVEMTHNVGEVHADPGSARRRLEEVQADLEARRALLQAARQRRAITVNAEED